RPDEANRRHLSCREDGSSPDAGAEPRLFDPSLLQVEPATRSAVKAALLSGRESWGDDFLGAVLDADGRSLLTLDRLREHRPAACLPICSRSTIQSAAPLRSTSPIRLIRPTAALVRARLSRTCDAMAAEDARPSFPPELLLRGCF